jgi:hypothetical protein
MDGLAGVRLGHHERRVLLEAASPDAEQGTVMMPPDTGRSPDEAQRRAMRRLHQLGLVGLR